MKALTNCTVKTCQPTCLIGLTRDLFSVPKTDKEIENAIAAGVSKKTSVDTNYCVRIWNEWAICKRASCTIVTPLETLSHSELQYYWLQRIILKEKKKKKDGARGRIFYGRIPALWHLEDARKFLDIYI